MKTTETKITICGNCKGGGIEDISDPSNWHLRMEDKSLVKITCRACKGSGRMLLTTTIEAVPFETGEPAPKEPRNVQPD